VRDAIMAVRRGAADRAVVPIENSLEGSVAATLDTLAIDAPQVRIVAERTLAIRQSLIAGRPLELEAIERVLSHPQALAQCAHFLRARLPGAEQTGAASTAEGVRQVAAGDAPWAALGSRLAAEEYGATVLLEGVEDRSDNVTCFVALAPAGDAGHEVPVEAGAAKTSIVFFGFNDVSPGALVAILAELSSRDINLTKIESRPRRLGLGHYMFFADLEGGEGEPHVAEALAALSGRVETLHVLGSYPSAARDDPPR
jgi:prephenate dehydratase